MPLPTLEADLAREFDMHRLADESDRTGFLAAHGHEFTGLVTSAGVGLDGALVRALPQLRVVSSFGVGFDALDEAALVRQGVRVGHTPGVLDECVADLAFALMMDVLRGVSAADRFVRRGEWRKGRFPMSRSVHGKRLGILGMGRIGQAVARRAAGFGMPVAYHNRRALAASPHLWLGSAAELATWADVLIVTAAGGAQTRHLVDASVLDALGPEGFLVNVSRGTVIDETALVQALQQGLIAGAGLDVFEREPEVPEALFTLDNVVLQPHVASGTHETRRAMADLVLENLRSYYRDGTLRAEVPWSAAAALAACA